MKYSEVFHILSERLTQIGNALRLLCLNTQTYKSKYSFNLYPMHSWVMSVVLATTFKLHTTLIKAMISSFLGITPRNSSEHLSLPLGWSMTNIKLSYTEKDTSSSRSLSTFQGALCDIIWFLLASTSNEITPYLQMEKRRILALAF